MRTGGARTDATAWATRAIPLLAALALPAGAAQVSGEVAVGYDSNPAQFRSGASMAFSRYSLSARESIPLDDTALGLALDGDYRDLEGANDNYRLALAGDWTHPTGGGMATLTFSLDAALYRDRLVAADERDEAAAGLRYERVLSARSDLALSAELRWLGYRNASLPWAGRPGGAAWLGAAGACGAGAGHGTGPRPTRRDDLLGALAAESTYHFSPDFDASLRAHVHRSHSPVEMEAYRQFGAGLSARLRPAPRWNVEVTLDWYRRDYDQGPRHLVRDDDRRSLAASVRHSMGDIELYAGAALTENDSSVAQKGFRQTVTECGIGWTF